MWTLPFLGRMFGHPYLVVHFIANRMILFNSRWRRVHDHMPTVHAVTGIHLSRDPEGNEKVGELLQADQLHVWKLDWKDPANHPEFWANTQKVLGDFLNNHS